MKTTKVLPKKVEIALNHVRTFFPDVCSVRFDKNVQWLYKTKYGEAPNFNNVNIDVSILEAAADSLTEYPIKFVIN